MTPKTALDELVAEGCFVRREDGWCYAAKPPTVQDLDWYVKRVKVLSAWTVGDGAKVAVTCGGTVDGLMWRVKE